MIAPDAQASSDVLVAFGCAVSDLEPDLNTIASTIADQVFPGALVPVCGQPLLYAAAPTHLAWRRLSPLLEARIGQELSNLPEAPVRDDAPPNALLALLGGFRPALWCAVRLSPETFRLNLAILACARLVENVRRNGAAFAPPPRKRSTGELLGRFDAAVNAGALDEAQAVLERLSAGGLLDGLNLRCLTVRLLFARGSSASDQLAALVEELRDLPLPRAVREIIDALR